MGTNSTPGLIPPYGPDLMFPTLVTNPNLLYFPPNGAQYGAQYVPSYAQVRN
jgi:hypothetical protein